MDDKIKEDCNKRGVDKKDAIFIGSIAALIGSSCCLGPVILVPLLIILGVGSLSASVTFLSEYKNELILLGFLFIAVAIIIYLKKKEGYCNIKTIWNNRHFIIATVLIYIIILLGILYLFLPVFTPVFFNVLRYFGL